MRLTRLTLAGYRRFSSQQHLNIDCRVIALLGPNEAGKTSLLNALMSLNPGGKFQSSGPSSDLSRDQNLEAGHCVLSAMFRLEEDDLQSLKEIPEAINLKRATLRRHADGKIDWLFDPAIKRSTENRQRVLVKIRNKDFGISISNPKLEASISSAVSSIITNITDEQAEILEKSALDALRNLALILRNAGMAPAASEIDSLVAAEEKTHPHKILERMASKRLPSFVKFEDEDRNLKSEYDLSQFYNEKNRVTLPGALKNLATIANLNLEQLYAAAQIGDQGRIRTLIKSANDKLKEQISSAWKQSDISVHFDLNGNKLSILAESAGTMENISERSSGLRQFVALCAFLTHRKEDTSKFILLIDEAEQHLHYDAQADLIRLLIKQRIASQIIYTTHSFGCLPEDLGLGMKFIEPNRGVNTSRIENKFWVGNIGLSPILFKMGAASMAFLPIRHCLLVEGATDMVLLPSLFKQALDIDTVGFQVAPGLAECSAAQISIIKNDGARVAFLMDKDDGGEGIREKLKNAGIPDNWIFKLLNNGDVHYEIEDFIDLEIYAQAVNDEIEDKNGKSDHKIYSQNLPPNKRLDYVADWCGKHKITSPTKINVAYRVLEKSHECNIVDAARKDDLISLYKNIYSLFEPNRQT